MILLGGLALLSQLWASTAWEWREEAVRGVEQKIQDLELQLLTLDISQLNLRRKWIESAVPLWKTDKELLAKEIERLNQEMINLADNRGTPTWNTSQENWQSWEKIGTKISDLEEKKSRLDQIITRLEGLKERLKARMQELKEVEKVREKEEKVILKSRLPLFCMSLAMVGYQEKIGTETDYYSTISGELGVRMPIPLKWWATSFFVGYEKRGYAGISIFIPVVKPEKGKPYGSWIEIGGRSPSLGLCGLSFEAENWRLFGRVFVSLDEDDPVYQVGLSYIF